MWRAVAPLADRGIGETAVVETLPSAVVDIFSLLTYLGDPVTLLSLVAAGYLLADRLGIRPTRMAAVIGLALGGVALTLALKHAFALPRPPGAGTDGFGFPSGHAVGATVVYGGLAGLFANRRLVRAAAGPIALVALSRVVIGVHYLVDVAVGVLVGAAYLAVAFRLGPGWAPDRVTAAAVARTFVLAVVVGLAALAVAVVADTVVVAAATVGGWLGWRLAGERVIDAPDSTRRLAVSLLVLPLVVAGGMAVETATPLPLAAGLSAGLVALLIAAPGVPPPRTPGAEGRSTN